MHKLLYWYKVSVGLFQYLYPVLLKTASQKESFNFLVDIMNFQAYLKTKEISVPAVSCPE